MARRLTSDESSYEMFPRFSPDGKQLAFTAQYDGNTEVYVMPADGGEPKRLTYTATLDRDEVSDRMGPNNIVMTWRDNESVIYRSRRTQWNPFKGELTIAKIGGGSPEILPLPRGGWCSYSPDGKQLAYNRVFREFRTWKRYRGGQTRPIWIVNLADLGITKVPRNNSNDFNPMWVGDKVYFLSDRDGPVSLYSYDIRGHSVTRLIKNDGLDIKAATAGSGSLPHVALATWLAACARFQ